MYAIDFEYDGEYLSDYGFIICNFSPSDNADVIESGSQIVFNTVPMNRGKNFNLISTKYDECIQTTFHICKNPEIYDDLKISESEFRDINRWLNRNEFLKFHLLDEESEVEPYYYASFNIKKINISEVLYGMELSLTTNSPFGFGDTQVKEIVIQAANGIKSYIDMSDVIGYTYPKIDIIPGANGDIVIQNYFDNKVISTTAIKNCTANEVITIDNDNKLITTDKSGHDVFADFNYGFFRICNTFNNRLNKIKSNLPCTIKITYMPMIKNSL